MPEYVFYCSIVKKRSNIKCVALHRNLQVAKELHCYYIVTQSKKILRFIKLLKEEMYTSESDLTQEGKLDFYWNAYIIYIFSNVQVYIHIYLNTAK